MITLPEPQAESMNEGREIIEKRFCIMIFLVFNAIDILKVPGYLFKIMIRKKVTPKTMKAQIRRTLNLRDIFKGYSTL